MQIVEEIIEYLYQIDALSHEDFKTLSVKEYCIDSKATSTQVVLRIYEPE